MTKYILKPNALKPLLNIFSVEKLAQKLDIHPVWLRQIKDTRQRMGPNNRRKLLAIYQEITGIVPNFNDLFQEVK